MFSYSKIPFDDYEITSLSLRPSKPKVSVLVIAYNHEKYILECLLGLKSQILNFSYEYFITDDQSTDNTSKIVNNFVLNNPNFFHLLRNVNLGKYTKNGRYNLLHGLSVLRGQFIAICDGDDYWTDPYKLQKQVDYLEKNPNCSICTHWIKTKDESEQTIHEDAFASKNRKNPMSNEDLFIDESESPQGTAYHPLSWVFPSKLIKNIPHWTLKIRGGDDVLFTEFIQHGYCYCIKEFMGTYRITKKSTWSPLDPMVKALAQIHFLINIRIHYAHYYFRVNKLLEIHLINLKNWKIKSSDFNKLIKEIFKICRNDPKSVIPLIEFYSKVFFHQFFYSSFGFIRIMIGKIKTYI